MDYLTWKSIAAAPACRAIRAGAETWALPNGGFFSGGRVYTHGLQTKRGTCYVVCREVMREVDATKFDMLATRAARQAVLILQGWAGRREYPVEVIDETPKRYRVKLLGDESALLPGHRLLDPGSVTLVPKTAVKIDSQTER